MSRVPGSGFMVHGFLNGFLSSLYLAPCTVHLSVICPSQRRGMRSTQQMGVFQWPARLRSPHSYWSIATSTTAAVSDLRIL